MATELNDLFKAHPPAEVFRPYCCYSRAADALNFFHQNVPYHSQRLTDHLTLFLSDDTNEPIGCRIKGVAGILEDLPNFLEVNHGKVKLRVVFLAFAGGADEATRAGLAQLASAAGDMLVDELTANSA